MVLMSLPSSEDSDQPVYMRSFAEAFSSRIHKNMEVDEGSPQNLLHL